MVMIVFAVRDAKAGAFMRPFVAPTIGTAIRSFDDECNRAAEDNMLHSHSEDFALYQVGTFDDADGSLVPMSPIKMLVQGDEVRRGFARVQAPALDKVSKV